MTTTRAIHRPTPGAQVVAAAGFVAVAVAAGLVGAQLQGSNVGVRYLLLERPAWAPERWLFGVVWPVLYVLIGVAGWSVWRTRNGIGRPAGALGLWLAQLLLNAIWPGVFFGLEAFGPAVAVIVALDIAVVATAVVFWRHDHLAAALLLPYLAWLLYATALNIAILTLN